MRSSRALFVAIDRQEVVLHRSGHVPRVFKISSSAYGVGSELGSQKTPSGYFRVCERIGDGEAIGTIFKSRQVAGHWSPSADEALENEEDLVLTRILWLDGMQADNANTRARYIYLHGTNHENRIGQPVSHGCIRLKNQEMLELFDAVRVGDPVWIVGA